MLLSVGLVIGTFTKKSSTSAYHLRMVSSMASLGTFSVSMSQYLIWVSTKTLRLDFQRILFWVLLLISWVITLVYGRRSVNDRLEEELKCVPKMEYENNLFTGDATNYVPIIQVATLFVLAAVVEPLRRRFGLEFWSWRRVGWWLLFCVVAGMSGVGFAGLLSYRVFMVYGMFALTTLFGWSVGEMLGLRRTFAPLFKPTENDWGFGQVLAFVLLAIPATQFLASLPPWGKTTPTFCFLQATQIQLITPVLDIVSIPKALSTQTPNVYELSGSDLQPPPPTTPPGSPGNRGAAGGVELGPQ